MKRSEYEENIASQKAIIAYYEHRLSMQERDRTDLCKKLAEIQLALSTFEDEVVNAPEKIKFAQRRLRELGVSRQVAIAEPKTSRLAVVLSQLVANLSDEERQTLFAKLHQA